MRILGFSKVTAEGTVILPMVLQIRETMVLRWIELEGKAGSPPFLAFVSFVALIRKHGFAEKLQI